MTREERIMSLLDQSRLWLGSVVSWLQEIKDEGNPRVTDHSISTTLETIKKFDKEMEEIRKPPVAYIGR